MERRRQPLFRAVRYFDIYPTGVGLCLICLSGFSGEIRKGFGGRDRDLVAEWNGT